MGAKKILERFLKESSLYLRVIRDTMPITYEAGSPFGPLKSSAVVRLFEDQAGLSLGKADRRDGDGNVAFFQSISGRDEQNETFNLPVP
jgi:hypothetical protein